MTNIPNKRKYSTNNDNNNIIIYLTQINQLMISAKVFITIKIFAKKST